MRGDACAAGGWGLVFLALGRGFESRRCSGPFFSFLFLEV